MTHQACFAQRETHHQLEIQMLTFTKQLSCTEVILDITRVQNKDGKRFFEGKEKSLKSFSFYCVCVCVHLKDCFEENNDYDYGSDGNDITR